MAHSTLPDAAVAAPPNEDEAASPRIPFAKLAALVPAVFLIFGYHPYSDDASVYVPGIEKLLDPKLFQPDAPFVLAMTKLSAFAHILAELVRLTHLPLGVVLLATYLGSIYLFLIGCWIVGSRVFRGTAERWIAVGFAAACFTLPAAGTALTLMDPYVTSRSISTPLGMLALAAAMDRRAWVAAALIILTGFMHPLMAVYAAALVILYFLVDLGMMRGALLLCAAAVACCGCIYLATVHIPVSAAYHEAISNRVRSFLFPWEWAWYEDLGLAAPLVLMGVAAYRAERGGRAWKLCVACILLGVTSIAAAFLFVHSKGPYFLVRLQILRSFQTLYLIGVVLLGGWLGKMLWYQRKTRWLLFVTLAAAAGGLYAAQRATYPDSAHVELPGMQPRNPWVQAYVWIRKNTLADAVFAANPNLELRDGEDMQGFRAITERSLLADNKNQGVAAVVNPSIADLWAKQRDAQIGIDQMSDQERLEKLKPLGVTWLLLSSRAETSFQCPYENAVAKVCVLD